MNTSTDKDALASYEQKILAGGFPDTPSGALERLLWSQVLVIEEGNSCWPWTGNQYKERNGEKTYGRFAVPAALMPTGRRNLTTAPRTVMWFALGHWPKTARHECDNPPCCRPTHLLDGTQADNNRDRSERGRNRNKPFARGTANPTAALTEDMVIASRILYRSGMSFIRIAEVIGRTESSVRQAATGQTWDHVTDPPPIAKNEVRSPGGKLRPDQILVARQMRADGMRPKDIARIMGVEPSNISYLTRNMREPRASTRRSKPFTDEEIRSIRRSVAIGTRQVDLLDYYGVTSATMSKIVRREIYKHVTD